MLATTPYRMMCSLNGVLVIGPRKVGGYGAVLLTSCPGEKQSREG